MATFLGF